MSEYGREAGRGSAGRQRLSPTGLPGPTQHGWSTVMCVGQTRVELAYWQRTRRTPELNEMDSGVCV